MVRAAVGAVGRREEPEARHTLGGGPLGFREGLLDLHLPLETRLLLAPAWRPELYAELRAVFAALVLDTRGHRHVGHRSTFLLHALHVGIGDVELEEITAA